MANLSKMLVTKSWVVNYLAPFGRACYTFPTPFGYLGSWNVSQPASTLQKCWLIYSTLQGKCADSLGAKTYPLLREILHTCVAPLRMGNCFGLLSRGTKPPSDGPGGPPGEGAPPPPPQKPEVFSVEVEDDDAKKLPPAPENNGLPRVSSRPPPDEAVGAAAAAPARTTSRS